MRVTFTRKTSIEITEEDARGRTKSFHQNFDVNDYEDGVGILDEYTKYVDIEFGDGSIAYAVPKENLKVTY